MDNNNEERRSMVDVQDKPTEVGIKLNNILTALVLMVMSWVGWNIQEMRKDIGMSKLETAVLTERLNNHIKNEKVHYNDKHSR